MSLLWIVVVILLVVALVGYPGLGVVNHTYGPYPSLIVTILLVVLVIFLLRGVL